MKRLLSIPRRDAQVLRDLFGIVRAGLADDLAHPDRLREPDRARREAEVYDRLLGALDGEPIEATAEVRRVLVEFVESVDAESEWERVAAEHDALHGLLARVEGRTV